MFLPTVPENADRKMCLFLFLLTLGVTLGNQGWSLLYTNFAVQEAHFTAADNGLVHSLREVPGLLGFTIIPVLLVVREHRLAVFAAIATGVGVILTGLVPSFGPVLAGTIIMSFGFHYFESINQSLMLQYFDLRTTPLVMGRLRGLAAGGSLAVSIFVFLGSDFLPFTMMFLIVGGVSAALGLWGLSLDPVNKALPPQRKQFILRPRYWLFYFLTFMMGARRLIFSVFALFLLVEHFHFSLRTIAILFMANYAINWFFNPLIGKCINAIGERALLSIEYILAIGVFLGYAYLENPWIVGALYVADSIIFNFAIAVRTFFQKIADTPDIAPSMAVAQTINHISAVIIPAAGGWLWLTFGYRLPFQIGAVLTFISLAAVQLINREIRRNNGDQSA